ncbi:ATP-binding protein [bacterium]
MYKIRFLEKKLIDSIKKPYITILLGARQTGKTSLLKQIKNTLSDYKSLFIDLDIFENKQIFSSYNEVLRYLKFNGLEDNKKFILFLDEFHTVSGINKILKNLYDNNSNIKIFATGSSSLDIIKKIKESLAGRKSIFHLYPLSFREFLHFKDEDLENKLININYKNIPENIQKILINYVKDFCIFGGYPEVVLSGSKSDKIEILRNIFDLFIKKDLIENLRIKNPFSALNILKFLAINTGQLINYNQICATNHIDISTLKHYLYLLSETFTIQIIPPFYSNKNKEIIKMPKIYFHDPGARNYFLNNFSGFDFRTDNSFLVENFVCAEFLKNKEVLSNIKYWRDKNGREIDFILEKENKISAYEIKYKKIVNKKDLSNLLYFKKMYPKAKIHLVNVNKNNDLPVQISQCMYFEIMTKL